MYILNVNGEYVHPPYETLEEAKGRGANHINDDPPPELKILRSSCPVEEWNFRHDTGLWHLWGGRVQYSVFVSLKRLLERRSHATTRT